MAGDLQYVGHLRKRVMAYCNPLKNLRDWLWDVWRYGFHSFLPPLLALNHFAPCHMYHSHTLASSLCLSFQYHQCACPTAWSPHCFLLAHLFFGFSRFWHTWVYHPIKFISFFRKDQRTEIQQESFGPDETCLTLCFNF